MNDLLRRVEYIQKECGDPKKKVVKVEGDEFSILKRDINFQLKEIRESIKKRDDMLANHSSSADIATASSQIRKLTAKAKESANQLKTLQLKNASKKKPTELEVAKFKKQEEMVDLVFQHLAEVEALQARRYQSSSSSSSNYLALAPTGKATAAAARDPIQTDLPPIEVQEGLAMLQERNEEIDQGLDELHDGVKVLKTMAGDMGRELELQDVMITDITNDVDHATEHLRNINRKMRKALDKARKGDKLILDIILLTVLLGIIAYIYNQSQN
eukprot:GCRY01001550.1.p1 GENE.GCRY01001550.1~~GCRY01001550.1.p1  ORF type:complete len:272 (-),score=70.59 GCRY01001550.1:57-872(-)